MKVVSVNAEYKMFCSEEIYEENIFLHWSRTDWRNFNRQNSLQWFGFSFLCFANNFFFTIVVASKCNDNQSSTIISQKSVQTKRTKYRSTFGWKFFFVQLCIYIFLLNYVLKCVISIFFGQNKMTDCDWLFL